MENHVDGYTTVTVLLPSKSTSHLGPGARYVWSAAKRNDGFSGPTAIMIRMSAGSLSTFASGSNDKFDAHVLAVAGYGSVGHLITANYSDFAQFTERFESETFTPDEMLCLINERRPNAVTAATKKQLSYWAGHPSSKSLPQALMDAGAPAFADQAKTLLATFALSGNC